METRSHEQTNDALESTHDLNRTWECSHTTCCAFWRNPTCQSSRSK